MISQVQVGESIQAVKINEIIDAVNNGNHLNPDSSRYDGFDDFKNPERLPWYVNPNNTGGTLEILNPFATVGHVQYTAVAYEIDDTLEKWNSDWYCGAKKSLIDEPESTTEETTTSDDDDLPDVIYTNNIEFTDAGKYYFIKVFHIHGPDDYSEADYEQERWFMPNIIEYYNICPCFAGKGGSPESECDCELTPLLDEGVKIATWTKNGVTKDIYAPEPESESECDCELVPVLTTGTKIAEWKKDGQTTDIYAPQGGGSCTCEMEATAEHYDKDADGNTQQYWPNAEVGKFTDCNGNETTLYAPNHVQFRCNVYPYLSNMGNVFELASATDSNIRITPNGTKLTIGCYYL